MTTRRSMFALFAGAAGAAVPTVAKSQMSQPEPRERRYINGKLICRCENPEWDEVSEPELSFTGWRMSGAHSHSISMGGPAEPNMVWTLKSTNHCIYCGGVEPPSEDE